MPINWDNVRKVEKQKSGINWDKVEEKAGLKKSEANIDPTVSKKGYTQEQQLEMIKDSLYGGGDKTPTNTASAFLGGVASGAALDVGLDELKQKYPEHKTALSLGSIIGNILPFGTAYKLAKPLTKGIANPVARSAATALLGDTPLGAIKGAAESIREGNAGTDIFKDAAKEAALYGGTGAILGPAVEVGLPALARKITPKAGQFFKQTPSSMIKKEVAATTLPDTTKHISTHKEVAQTGIKEKFRTAYSKLFDNVSKLKQLDDYTEKVTGQKLPYQDRSYVLALNSRGADNIAASILEERAVNQTGEVISKPLKNILEQVPKNNVLDFEDYLIHRHAPSWMEQGRKVFPDELNITTDISRAKVAEYEAKYPQFKKMAEELNDFQRKVGKAWLVDTGIIKPETWNKFLEKYPNYVPLKRVLSDIEKGGSLGPKRGFANQANPVKRAKGSQRQIISPIESIIEQVYSYVRTAKRNEVMQKVIKNIESSPEDFKGFAEIVKKTGENIDNDVLKDGLDEALQQLNKGFDVKPDLTRPNIVTGIVNGEKVYVKVNDPGLLEALTNLNDRGQNAVVEGVRQVTRVFKNLTTGVNPVFGLLRNIFRDIPTAYTFSKTTNNPITFAKDLLGSFVSVLKNDDLYKSFKSIGGGFSSSVSADRNVLQETKERLLPGYIDYSNPLTATKRLAGKGLTFVERLNNTLESAPRLAEYKRVVKSTPGKEGIVRGLYEAQDVTVNFQRRGSVIKDADAFIPYLNAAVQGLDKLVRSFKDNPVQTAGKAFASITVPTIVLYAINHDNPNYQMLNEFTKDNYFLIPKKDGTFIKIPKPRELGVMFGSDVERLLRLWKDKDPEAFNKFTETVLTNFIPPTRTIAAPLVDVKANKDFLDRPIVNARLERLSPALQYDESTSEVSKNIGKTLNVSPKKIDYLIRSYGGIVGQLGIPATTQTAQTSPLGRMGETLKRQITVDPVFSNDILNNFYEKKDRLDRASADYKVTKQKSQDYNETLRKQFNKAADKISDINKKIREVESSNLPPEERDARIRELRIKMLEIAKQQYDKAKGKL